MVTAVTVDICLSTQLITVCVSIVTTLTVNNCPHYVLYKGFSLLARQSVTFLPHSTYPSLAKVQHTGCQTNLRIQWLKRPLKGNIFHWLSFHFFICISNPRIQSSTAKQNEGQTPKNSFSARAQATADKKQGKWGGGTKTAFYFVWFKNAINSKYEMC